MNIVLFYEKPGCATNARQKALLRNAQCLIIERNLLEHGMNEAELLEFLEGLTVPEWFNPAAPAIRDGLIDPHALSKNQALEALMASPILIRRPLMVIEGRKMCGFNQEKVEALLGRALGKASSEACNNKRI